MYSWAAVVPGHSPWLSLMGTRELVQQGQGLGLWGQYSSSPQHIAKGESIFWKHHCCFLGETSHGVLEPACLHLQALAEPH